MKRKLICLLMVMVATISLCACGSSDYDDSSQEKAKCQFKDSDGSRNCTNEATRGQLCDYHFKLLDDTYKDLEDSWNNLD